MASISLSDTEIKSLKLGDMHLVCIEWKGKNSPNLRIVLDGGSLSVPLVFTWVAKLLISLDPKGFSAMTWDVNFVRAPDGRWQVQFDFASDGVIEFECGEIISDPDNSNDVAN